MSFCRNWNWSLALMITTNWDMDCVSTWKAPYGYRKYSFNISHHKFALLSLRIIISLDGIVHMDENDCMGVYVTHPRTTRQLTQSDREPETSCWGSGLCSAPSAPILFKAIYSWAVVLRKRHARWRKAWFSQASYSSTGTISVTHLAFEYKHQVRVLFSTPIHPS